MSIAGIEIFAIIGFIFAAYAVVGNDALQTLGTFINSNRRLHWTILFGFAAAILVLTFTYGWVVNGGDPSYDRLTNTDKYPVIPVQWYHILPPLVLLVITRLGIPVSTSFMVLTIFASVGGLASMIEKSLMGYGLAFVVGAGLYVVINKTLERHFEENPVESFIPRGLILIGGSLFLIISQFLISWKDMLEAVGESRADDTVANIDPTPLFELFTNMFTESNSLLILLGIVLAFEIIANILTQTNRRLYWVTVQWVTTGYLWSVWLIQDFANIFVFLPREINAVQGFGAMAIITVLLGYTFANRGGPVQKILQTKSNVTDIRSATIIDFLYASLLFFFKELSDLPMSTTWVFLGLIAGREYAFAFTHKVITWMDAVFDTFADLGKAFLGLVISIDLAVGLPLLGNMLDPQPEFQSPFASDLFLWFVIVANVMLPVALFFLWRKTRPNAALFFAVMAIGAALFFWKISELKSGGSAEPAAETVETIEAGAETGSVAEDVQPVEGEGGGN